MQRIIFRAEEDVKADELARRFNADVENLKRFNDVKDIIRRGERVIIDCREGEYYVVQPFDDLPKIAKKFCVDEQTLAECNSSKVFIGQKIFIPKDSKNE